MDKKGDVSRPDSGYFTAIPDGNSAEQNDMPEQISIQSPHPTDQGWQ